jgi:hypothetical protein
VLLFDLIETPPSLSLSYSRSRSRSHLASLAQFTGNKNPHLPLSSCCYVSTVRAGSSGGPRNEALRSFAAKTAESDALFSEALAALEAAGGGGPSLDSALTEWARASSRLRLASAAAADRALPAAAASELEEAVLGPLGRAQAALARLHLALVPPAHDLALPALPALPASPATQAAAPAEGVAAAAAPVAAVVPLWPAPVVPFPAALAPSLAPSGDGGERGGRASLSPLLSRCLGRASAELAALHMAVARARKEMSSEARAEREFQATVRRAGEGLAQATGCLFSPHRSPPGASGC